MKKVKVSGDRNQCAGCGEVFNSTAAFDKHRTGEFGVDRGCLNMDGMVARKMAKNAAGFWVTALNPLFSGEVSNGAAPAIRLTNRTPPNAATAALIADAVGHYFGRGDEE